MDAQQRRAIMVLIAWLYQSTQQNSLAQALIVFDQSREPQWAYRPYRRLGPIRRFIDIWAEEEDGGFNDNFFEFYTRFTKAEVKRLASVFELPTKFAIDGRGTHATVESPEHALAVFLWRAAHPVPLGFLITYFGKSRPWLSRVYNGVLDYIWDTWSSRISFDHQLMCEGKLETYAHAIGHSFDSNEDELIFGFINGTQVTICRPK
ncbi:hypothetical protein CC80DRAFT_591893 [Byssothecium circinans]|uniref:Uncharacterized protein n=1 Tax=Byssothecium circinans TaxID=147558 RepID=A0A6A5UAG1_9PLEO|nr:hypothetical protein CC80DRAFT_591893 [Byssothecium circinans]